MGEIAIYRSIFGGYDRVFPACFQDEADNYLVTDRAIKIDGYRIIIINDPIPNLRRESRRYKMQPWNYLPKYKYYIYLDGTIEMIVSPKKLIDEYINGFDLAVLKHPWRNCIYDEAEICKKMGLATEAKIDRQVKIMRNAGYPENNGLTENGVMIWRNTIQNQIFGSRWWNFYMEHTQRDQLSFCFIAWEMAIKYNIIETEIRKDSDLFKFTDHDRTLNADRKPS